MKFVLLLVMVFLCKVCKQNYPSQRSLSRHLSESQVCIDLWQNCDSENESDEDNKDDLSESHENDNSSCRDNCDDLENNEDQETIETDNNTLDSSDDNTLDSSDGIDSNIESNFDVTKIKANFDLINQQKANDEADYGGVIDDYKDYRSGVELMDILKKAKAPLNVYDKIQNWATRSTQQYGVQFAKHRKYNSQKKLLNYIKKCHNIHGLQPIVKKI